MSAEEVPRDPHLLLLGTADRASMRIRLREVGARAAGAGPDELDALAAELAAGLPADAEVRAAALVRDADTLVQRLGNLERWVEGDDAFRGARGSFLGAGPPARIGFLFPGLGVPVYTTAGAIGDRFPGTGAPFEAAGLPEHRRDVAPAQVQVSVVAASLAALRALRELGVEAGVGVGHSMGELTALHWAGVLDEDATVRIARAVESVAAHANADGTMATILGDEEVVARAVEGTGAVVAAVNSPTQRVVSGTREAVAAAGERARELGARAYRLRLTGAYHTPLMLDATREFQGEVAKEALAPLERRVISTVSGEPCEPEVDTRALIERLLCQPVQFLRAATTAAGECDLLIEVGPGKMLSGLVAEFADTPAVPIRAGSASAYGLLEVVGAAYAAGAPVCAGRVFEKASSASSATTRATSRPFQASGSLPSSSHTNRDPSSLSA